MLNMFMPKVKAAKKKFKTGMWVAGGLFLLYSTYHVADKYFNKESAEENVIAHTTKLFGKAPDMVSCPDIDTGNHDSRVMCEARYGEEVKVYLCAGFLDGFDSSCIAPKFAAIGNNN